MKLKLDRIIGIATLIASLTAILLVLRRPAPVVSTQPPTVIVQQPPTRDRESVQRQAQSAAAPGPTDVVAAPAPSTTVRPAPSAPRAIAAPVTASSSKPDSNSREEGASDTVSSALAQILGGAAGPAALSPNANVGTGTPVIKDQQVTMEGDIVHGRFLTEIAGKEVWVTISGHMGEKDGYATFDPTEFKVGDTSIPVSLVNPSLQKKLAEERERLKITSQSAP